MSEAAILFHEIATRHAALADVAIGKMMTSPGIRYQTKNYAFYHEERMCFKLGKNYDIEIHGITEWSYLSPFKTKPAMTAWYYVSYIHADTWKPLAIIALDKMKLAMNKNKTKAI